MYRFSIELIFSQFLLKLFLLNSKLLKNFFSRFKKVNLKKNWEKGKQKVVCTVGSRSDDAVSFICARCCYAAVNVEEIKPKTKNNNNSAATVTLITWNFRISTTTKTTKTSRSSHNREMLAFSLIDFCFIFKFFLLIFCAAHSLCFLHDSLLNFWIFLLLLCIIKFYFVVAVIVLPHAYTTTARFRWRCESERVRIETDLKPNSLAGSAAPANGQSATGNTYTHTHVHMCTKRQRNGQQQTDRQAIR